MPAFALRNAFGRGNSAGSHFINLDPYRRDPPVSNLALYAFQGPPKNYSNLRGRFPPIQHAGFFVSPHIHAACCSAVILFRNQPIKPRPARFRVAPKPVAYLGPGHALTPQFDQHAILFGRETDRRHHSCLSMWATS